VNNATGKRDPGYDLLIPSPFAALRAGSARDLLNWLPNYVEWVLRFAQDEVLLSLEA